MIENRTYPKTGPDSIYCEFPGCEATSGDEPIFRTSPKGGPFKGRCDTHMRRLR